MADQEGALEHEELPIPDLDYRWVHTGSQYLDLLPTPITTASTSYKAFSPDESRRIEEAWNKYTPEERQKSIHDWGRKEGEGFATPPIKKDKEKDKDKERRGSNASVRSVDRNVGSASGSGKVEDGEMIRSGEEQPHDEEKDSAGKYKDIMAKAQLEYENLELISGVPVSQVSPAQAQASFCYSCISKQCDMVELMSRTRYSKSRSRRYRSTRRSGHMQVREYQSSEARGSSRTRRSLVHGISQKSSKRVTSGFASSFLLSC